MEEHVYGSERPNGRIERRTRPPVRQEDLGRRCDRPPRLSAPPDYVGYSADRPAGVESPDEFAEYVSSLHGAFPNLDVTLGVVSTGGDRVVVNWRATGTNDGEFMGTAPTGKSTTLMGTTLCHVADGKVRESRSTVFRSG